MYEEIFNVKKAEGVRERTISLCTSVMTGSPFMSSVILLVAKYDSDSTFKCHVVVMKLFHRTDVSNGAVQKC